MDEIALATQTTFAELLQRCLDAEFDETYSERGRFVRVRSRGKTYWHFRISEDGQRKQIYVGPYADPSITDRVNRFASIKSDFKERRELVRSLVAAGLPAPDAVTGAVVEAMWKAGFFRLRGVLVGTVAFQTYAGPLGIKMRGRPLQTQDADFAQFWGISEHIGDSMPPIIDVLQNVDGTFREIASLNDPFVSARYRNARRYVVDLLVPNRGSNKYLAKPVRMKALGGSGAQPMRHLDYLIHEPERSLLLYKGGIPVTVPRAERFAVHKLIVAASRDVQAKSAKDIWQATTLIEALKKHRPQELADAWTVAWGMGPRWREKLQAGRERLPAVAREWLTGTR
jgi:hypothetical protein